MVNKSDETAPDVPAAAAPAKPSPRRTSNMSQASAVSSRQSFASEYSYHESEGETPAKPAYDEEASLAAPHEQHEPSLRGVVAPVLRQRVFLSRERGRNAAQTVL